MGTKVTQIAVVTSGAHEVVRVWIDEKLSGELTVGLGEGDHVVKLLEGAPSPLEKRIAWLEAKLKLTYCEKHGHYTRTDENVCPACRRGE